jgi:hypothetical protein
VRRGLALPIIFWALQSILTFLFGRSRGFRTARKKFLKIFQKSLVKANIVVHNVLMVLVHYAESLGFGMEEEGLVE